jgi:hypothetical protein
MSDAPGGEWVIGGESLSAAIAKLYLDTSDLSKAKTRVVSESKQIEAALNDINKVDPFEFMEGSATKATRAINQATASARGFGAAGALLSNLGLPGGESLRITGELVQTTRLLDNLSGSLRLMHGPIGNIARDGEALAVSLPGVSLGMGSILAIAAPLAVAVGGIALAWKGFEDVIAPSAANLKAASDALSTYFDVIQTGTTKSIQKKIDDLRGQKSGVDSEITVRQTALDNAFTSEKYAGLGGDLGARIKFLLASTNPEFRAMGEELQKLQGESTKLGTQLVGLQQALGSSNVKANDAAEAERELAQERSKAASQAVTDAVASGKLARTASSDSVKEKIAELQDTEEAAVEQIGKINDLVKAGSATDEDLETRKKLIDQLQAATAEEKNLTEVVLPATEARERQTAAEKHAADASKRFTEELNKFNKRVEEAADAQAEIDRKTADFNAQGGQNVVDRARLIYQQNQDFERKRLQDIADNGKKIAREDADYHTARVQKVRDFNTKYNQILTDADKEQLQTTTEFSRESVQAAKDLQDKILEIERNTKEEVRRASSRLDAISVLEAQRNGQRQITDATNQYSAEQQKRKESLRIKLDDIAANAKVERTQQLAAFNQQLADDDQQHETRKQREIEDFQQKLALEDGQRDIDRTRQAQEWARQDAAKLAAYNKEIGDLQTKLLTPEEEAKKAAYARMVAAAREAGGQIVSAFNDGIRGAPTNASGRTVSSTALPPQTDFYAGQSGQSIIDTYRRIYNQSSIQHFAAGTSSVPLNQVVKVGEYGPELAVFRQNASILPADISSRLLSGASGGGAGGDQSWSGDVVLQINGDIGGWSEDDIYRIAKRGAKDGYHEYIKQATGKRK